MQTEKFLEKLRHRTKTYLVRIPVAKIKDDEPAAIVLAPVETGISKFIDVDSLPSLDDLPFIPERMRDFAFRYATEYKPIKYWAREYGITPARVSAWLQHDGVRAYIAICRFEQRMFNLAQRVTMQRNVYRTINAILTTKITADTIGSIVSMAKFVYQIVHNPQEAPDRSKGTLNVNIGYSSDPPSRDNGGNPYAQERNVTPQQVDLLKGEIEELEVLAEGIRRNKDNGDEE
jgi:hypothetical protein